MISLLYNYNSSYTPNTNKLYIIRKDNLLDDSHKIFKYLINIDIIGLDNKPLCFIDIDMYKKPQIEALNLLLNAKPSTKKILLISNNKNKGTESIEKLFKPKIKNLGINKKDTSIWGELGSYVYSRKVPKDNNMLLLLKSIGNTKNISYENLSTACEIDTLLFKTNSEYLTHAWAGLHKVENKRLNFRFKKKETAKKPVKAKPKKAIKGKMKR